MPELSVVLPVFRAPKTIRAAIESVLNQSYRDLELIVVLNGSDEDTKSEVDGIRDRRMRVLELEEANVVRAANLGLAQASGELIGRMDADDLSHPDRFQEQVSALKRNRRLGVVSCRVRFQSQLSQARGFHRYVLWQNRLTSHRDMAHARFVEAPLVNPSAVFRRSILAMPGDSYRDGAFPEDYEFWLRVFDGGTIFSKLRRTLYVWNDHPGRLTRTDARYSESAFQSIKAPYLAGQLRRHGVSDKRPLLIWGAGKISRRFHPLVLKELNLQPEAYIDIDPRKIGRDLRGRPIISPDRIQRFTRPFLLTYVAGWDARLQIARFLGNAGLRMGHDFLHVA